MEVNIQFSQSEINSVTHLEIRHFTFPETPVFRPLNYAMKNFRRFLKLCSNYTIAISRWTNKFEFHVTP